MGWTIRECSEEVRFGTTRLLSSSRLIGRDSPERGLEVKDGAMLRVSSFRRLGGKADYRSFLAEAAVFRLFDRQFVDSSFAARCPTCRSPHHVEQR